MVISYVKYCMVLRWARRFLFMLVHDVQGHILIKEFLTNRLQQT